MSSKNYWREREERQRKQNIKNEAEHQKKLDDIYANMLDNIEKEINGFLCEICKSRRNHNGRSQETDRKDRH